MGHGIGLIKKNVGLVRCVCVCWGGGVGGWGMGVGWWWWWWWWWGGGGGWGWGVYWIYLVPSVRPSVCSRHGFGSVTQVCFRLSITNFICLLFVAMGLWIISDVTFKMSAWQPYWIFWSKLHWHITYTCACEGSYWFSAVSLSKWPPFWIFRYLDSVQGGMVSGA